MPNADYEGEAEAEAEDVEESGLTKAKQKRPTTRLWCQILLHKQHTGFDLIPMLIGRGGCNMRDIHEKTNAKVRIRGRGSGYFEVEGRREAPVPLMVVVTADKADTIGFKRAVSMTIQKLRHIAERFRQFCEFRGYTPGQTPLYSIGELSKGSEFMLEEELKGIPNLAAGGSPGQQQASREQVTNDFVFYADGASRAKARPGVDPWHTREQAVPLGPPQGVWEAKHTTDEHHNGARQPCRPPGLPHSKPEDSEMDREQAKGPLSDCVQVESEEPWAEAAAVPFSKFENGGPVETKDYLSDCEDEDEAELPQLILSSVSTYLGIPMEES